MKSKISTLLNRPTLILVVGLLGCFALSCDTKKDPSNQKVTKAVSTEFKSSSRESYSPYLVQDFPKEVYFGDTHLHTSYSTDAGLFGNTLGPEEAYRFAKGEEVISSLGVKARLSEPLDFLVIADHAENLGLAPMLAESNPMVIDHPWGKEIAKFYNEGDLGAAYTMWGSAVADNKDPFEGDTKMQTTMWTHIIEAAERHNEPGKFTAFIGFEWTSSPGGSNMHRNVIFRDDGKKASQVIPYSVYDSEDPEDLWRYMENYEKKTGGQVLAIAHNGNLSNGLMFDDVTFGDKSPLDKDYAIRRMEAEPLYEVTQIKGDGETHPELSPDDEFADFGTWDKGSFQRPKEEGMIEKEYARTAYLRGLEYEIKIGVNPFKFGMVGSTDSHTSLATAEEDNFYHKATPAEPTFENFGRQNQMVTGFLPDPEGREYAIYAKSSLASGLAAVWAIDNTREAIWDAMKRKEVYATTGTRLRVRLFAGWDFTEKDLYRHDFVRYGYEHGVPMGGDLIGSENISPKFLVHALKDPNWANLDRIQMIKGWTDETGKAHERIYDIAVSGNRIINADGRCPEAVGNSVNVDEATFDNSIGESELKTFWEDPEFNPNQRAFYYVRVLEIPTPNWTVFDAKQLNIPLPNGVPTSIQDRAYTSPIWYSPN